MATQRIRLKPPSALRAEQKVAFALLMFLGIGGLVLGFQSFQANMMRPIQQQIAELYTGETYLSVEEREAREMEEAKKKDTDSDGLVDYDELYIYKTSPYIVDSDSDGYDDKQEVFSGNNPNCPVGQNCALIMGSTEEEVAPTSAADALIEGLGVDELLEAGAIDFSSEEDIEAFFKQATIEEIRSALIEAGMSKEELDQIDDETLQAFFYGALDEAALSGSLSEFVTPAD